MLKRTWLLLIIMVFGFCIINIPEVMAGRDCSNGANTCWSFDLGYKIEVLIAGEIDEVTGLQEWTYEVTKKNNASANFIYLGLEKDIKLDATSNYDHLYPPCIGDTTEKVGIGDCLRQTLKWTASLPTGTLTMTYYVQPVETNTTVTAFMKGADDTESGTILGPAADKAEVIESTFFIDQTDDGRALAVKMDRNGNIIQAWSCDTDCENFPTNFNEITAPKIPLSETFFCIPAGADFDDNSDLTIGGEPVTNLHCGSVEFKDVDSSIQFSNRGSCRVLPSGGLFCY